MLTPWNPTSLCRFASGKLKKIYFPGEDRPISGERRTLEAPWVVHVFKF
jgi:hypothetical protein